VADFGIARALTAAGGERLTESGLVVGTPAYMSPEQAAADGQLDGRSDVYALGCVAYEVLAGVPPFTGPTALAIMARHAVDPVPPLRTVRPGVPAPVVAAIERALAKVPADRFATAGEFAQALAADTVGVPPLRGWRPGRRFTVALGGAGALVGVVASSLTWLNARTPSVLPAAATMAVLPFSSGIQDTALDRLGRDLAITISASLDGVGGIRTADRLTVATATAHRPSLSAAEAAALGWRLGASSVLRGTLVRAGDVGRLDAGLYRTDGLVPLAEGITVSGHRDSIGALTDSASWAVLRQVWQRGTPPSPSLAAVTTHSLPALRAFLDGETRIVAGEWREAALAFAGAIAGDSTFGMAYFHYVLAQLWLEQPIPWDMVGELKRHRDEFPERERLLTDALLAPGANVALEVDLYGAVPRRFPDYWPGWFLYGDLLSHGGVAVTEWSDGLEAFQRAVALNPDLVPAWEHLFRYSLSRRPEEADRALARLTALGWPPAGMRGTRIGYPLLVAVSRAGGMFPPELGQVADSLAAAFAMVPPENEYGALVAGPLSVLVMGFPAAQLELNRRALKTRKASPRVMTALRAANAWAWATRGQWDSALTTIKEIATTDPGPIGIQTLDYPHRARPVLAIESYGLAVLGAWLGTVRPTAALERRPAAVAAINQLDDVGDRQEGWGRVAWLDGLLAFARGDRAGIRIARGEAAHSQYPYADLVYHSLDAFDRALRGDRKGAARMLAHLEDNCINGRRCNGFTPQSAVHRLAAAQWLLETGEVERARRLLLGWVGGGLAPSGAWWWMFDEALSGPVYLLRARLEESRDSSAQAGEFYRLFLRNYDRPMPSQVALVEEARNALAHLAADR
jgi:tetratricopeptide (TPR) repeat protein